MYFENFQDQFGDVYNYKIEFSFPIRAFNIREHYTKEIILLLWLLKKKV